MIFGHNRASDDIVTARPPPPTLLSGGLSIYLHTFAVPGMSG